MFLDDSGMFSVDLINMIKLLNIPKTKRMTNTMHYEHKLIIMYTTDNDATKLDIIEKYTKQLKYFEKFVNTEGDNIVEVFAKYLPDYIGENNNNNNNDEFANTLATLYKCATDTNVECENNTFKSVHPSIKQIIRESRKFRFDNNKNENR